jgi:hypothetical protein
LGLPNRRVFKLFSDVTQNRDKLSMEMAFPAKIFLSAVRNISYFA